MRYSAARASPRRMWVKYVSSSDLTPDISLRVDEITEKFKKNKKQNQNEPKHSNGTGPDEVFLLVANDLFSVPAAANLSTGAVVFSGTC